MWHLSYSVGQAPAEKSKEAKAFRKKLTKRGPLAERPDPVLKPMIWETLHCPEGTFPWKIRQLHLKETLHHVFLPKYIVLPCYPADGLRGEREGAC